jgi:hypothetical protein
MFFENTISKIVGDLEDKVAKLLAHAENLKSSANEKQAKAASLVAQSDAHKAEADRAIRIAEKVKAILD